MNIKQPQKKQLAKLSAKNVNWEIVSDSQAQSVSGGYYIWKTDELGIVWGPIDPWRDGNPWNND